MKRKRYTEEQIISILKEHEAGATVPDLLRRHGVAENTICRWKSKYGGMEVSEAKRLRELEAENAKLNRPRVPMLVPDQVNERWSMDFVSDQLANGRRFRVLNVVDDFSRECVLQVVDFSISGQRLARELDQLGERRALPKSIVCDNGLNASSFSRMQTK
jgi:transposase InsO family protein